MKTTNLFIELLVIGVGAVMCISLMVYLIFGVSVLSINSLESNLLIVPFTAVTYVLSIVFDRIFDIIINKWDKSIRKKCDLANVYDRIRTVDYNESKII